MNKQRGRKAKLTEENGPVSYKRSVLAGFAKQLKGKVCPICQKTIAFGIYRSHFDRCDLKIEEEECLITDVITASQKIGPPIVLDQSFEDVKPSTSVVETKEPERVTTARRRSARKITKEGSPVEEKIVKKSRTTVSIEGETTKLTREEVILQESGTFEPVEAVQAFDLGFDFNAPGPKKEEEEPFNLPSTSTSPPKTPSKENTDPIKEEVLTSPEKDPEFEKYTVRLVNKMIHRVIYSENSPYGPEFWGSTYKTISAYEKLRNKEKELFLRLFLRKRQWFSQNQLKERYSMYPDLDSLVLGLKKAGFLEDGSAVISLEEVITLAQIDVLKRVAKVFRVDHKQQRSPLKEALKKQATHQNDLFGRSKGIGRRMISAFLKEYNGCFRIAKEVDIPLKAIFTLYSPTETNSSLVYDDPRKNIEGELLFTLLNHGSNKVNFPGPVNCTNLLNIYRDYDELKKYVEAKDLEVAVAKAVYCQKLEEAIELGKGAQQRLEVCDLAYCRSLSLSIRRFTSPTVFLRILAHVATALEKMKQHADAVILQRFLLYHKDCEGFCCDNRGSLWERLALNLETHLKDPEEALEHLTAALADPFVKEKDQVTLQDRARRLTRGQIDLVIHVSRPKETKISGAILRKNLGDARQNRFIRNGTDGSVTECSVEEIARQHYLLNEGMTHGVHAEGSIWHTVFGLLFYDIIFSHKIPETWFNEIQTHPVDLNYPEFYERRRESFEERLRWLEKAEDGDLCRKVESIWDKYFDTQNSEIVWNLFQDVNECTDLIKSCPRAALVGIFSRLSKDYRNTRSGFPDLTLWNPRTSSVAVVEVKGPGDRLSSKQRLWLQRFSELGIRAEVCYVAADRDRTIKI